MYSGDTALHIQAGRVYHMHAQVQDGSQELMILRWYVLSLGRYVC